MLYCRKRIRERNYEIIMVVDNSFMIHRIHTFKEVFMLYSGFTHRPFIECDDETFNDQVYLFTSAAAAQEFAVPYTQDKILLQAVQIPQEKLDAALKSLYLYSVNAVVVQDEGAPVTVELDKLAEKPDMDKLEKDVIPRANPELQLTGLYFMQELSRPVKRTPEEAKRLQSMEEEMVHNLFHARLIISFDTTDVPGEWNPQNKEQQGKVKIPMVQTKDGKFFQPIYTDLTEFKSFNAKTAGRRLQIGPTGYDYLEKLLVPKAEGVVINPGGFNLRLNRDQLKQMKVRYANV